MIPPDLDPARLAQRYDLLCRALQATPSADGSRSVEEQIRRLDTLIHRELLDLARLGSPDDFADIYLGFGRELDRFREFCADPRLASKTIVAFGGPFSAGKSSLINALIGHNLLVVEIDPTTALPAYLFAGETDAVHALNLHRQRIALTDEELASLTHDEPRRYGSQVSRALLAAFITRRDFPWANLAFIDTPGYSGQAVAGDRTDADIAAAQMADAHAIVWVVSIKQGDLTEEDLAFLARLDPAIPRVVVASHADLVPERDRAAIIERMRATLVARNLPVLGVYPVSARPRHAALLAPLRAQLDAWNQTRRQQRFTYRFKALFTRYQRGLEREIAAARWQLHRINRIVTLAEGDVAADAAELKTAVDERLAALKAVETRLTELRTRFFAELKRVGDGVGVALPEPHEVELLEEKRSNLLALLVALREKKGDEAPDMRVALQGLRRAGEARNGPLLTRRARSDHRMALAVLTKPGEAAHRQRLLRRPESPMRKALQILATLIGGKMNLLDTLTRAADEEQLLLHPLPKHAAAEQEEHLRHHYALLLAALLTAQPAVSDAQTRLFRLLLDSLGLGDIRGQLYAQARELEPAALVEAVRLVRGAGLARHLVLDALVLLRLEAPLNDEISQLIGELAALLGLRQEELAEQAEGAAAILGINPNESGPKDPAVSSFREALAELWPSRKAVMQPLTADALRAGLRDGTWRLEADLLVDFAWQASNATLIFLNDATLSTVVSGGNVTLTDCDLRNARLHFSNDGSAHFERCKVTGHYDNRPDCPAIESFDKSLTVVDCDFTTRDGVAIAVVDAGLKVTQSRFTDCGRSDGGTIFHTNNKREITDCRFERCIGSHGGAIFVNTLYGIHRCEFIACESRAFDDKRFAKIAVFSERNEAIRVITGCRFQQSSLYVGDSYSGSWRMIAYDCQFLNGHFIYWRNDNHILTPNCTFENGQVIEAELK